LSWSLLADDEADDEEERTLVGGRNDRGISWAGNEPQVGQPFAKT